MVIIIVLVQNLSAAVEALNASLEQKNQENLNIRAQFDQLAASYTQNQSSQVDTPPPPLIIVPTCLCALLSVPSLPSLIHSSFASSNFLSTDQILLL
jgi:hypothetical protein